MFERFLNKKLNQNRANSILPTILVRRTRPMIENFNKLMSYYKCAMMEVETKLNVLNEEFSLQ